MCLEPAVCCCSHSTPSLLKDLTGTNTRVLWDTKISFNGDMARMKKGGYLGIGMGIGVALGVAMGNMGVGIAIGLAVGFALASGS